MKNKNQRFKKIFLFILLFFLIILYLLIYQLNNKQNLSIKAQDDADFCKNHCQSDPCTSLPDFYDEACCLEIQRTGDPTACPWPQRGWCFAEHCSTIPEEVNKLRCSVPRYSWCEMCQTKCGNRQTAQSTLPTNPQFIITVTFAPTLIPIEPTVNNWHQSLPISPTTKLLPIPTKEINILPTIPVLQRQSLQSMPKIKLPNFSLPKINISFPPINPQKITQPLQKSWSFFEQIDIIISKKILEIINWLAGK